MKKYKVIYLDQDGVLCSFTRAVIKQVNLVMGQNVTIEQAIKESNWDLEHLWDLNQKDWWEIIDKDPNFWLNIPMFPWATQLYNNLMNYADEVVILTSPAQNPKCVTQKMIWLRDNMGVHPKYIVTTKKKYLLARNDALLIDDSRVNCDGFIDCGGNAVCIPSDWNTHGLTFDKVWEVILNEINS